MSKCALLYDYLQVNGGAEAVTLDLLRRHQDLSLLTAFVDERMRAHVSSDLLSRIRTLTSASRVPGWYLLKSAWVFEHRSDLSRYDTVVFSGVVAPLAALRSSAARNIYYCHTPPRFIYDLKEFYLEQLPVWQRPALKALIAYLQPRYERALARMDRIFCNSINVQTRLRTWLGVEAEVLYPPCAVERFGWHMQGDYFLSTARVEDYKRVELIVRAFMQMPDKKLVVASGGGALERLRQLAAKCGNIRFTGWVSEAELAALMANCLATIYIPMDEDFGMSPVESMGAGKPVLGVAEGGVLETVIPNQTGWLLPAQPTLAQLCACVQGISAADALAMREACEQRARMFAGEAFYSTFAALLEG